MYNKITLIGTMVDRPEEIYDPAGNLHMCFSLNVPLPPDSPLAYWGLVYDLRTPVSVSDWTVGDDTFLVICRDPLLVERCLQSLHKSDVVCVEGRLVLTVLRCNNDHVPLAEILASNVILLTEHSSLQVQEE